WAAVRTQRQRPPVQNGTGRASRTAVAAALLGVAGATAALAGPSLPGAASHPRTVLRSYVTPPFNVRDYPSPLAGFRRYVKGKPNTLYGTALFTVAGLPAGTRLRIAVLTSYDGAVWAAGPGGGAEDSFRRVGRTIAGDAAGRPVSLAITVDRYSDVWLPDTGVVTGVAFDGPNPAAHAAAFGCTLAPGRGSAPAGRRGGPRCAVRASLPAGAGAPPPAADPTVDAGAVPPVKARAARWAGPSADPWSRIGAVAAALRQGA